MTAKVNIIMITHEEIGAALLHTVSTALGEIPLPTTVITVSYSADPDKLVNKLKKLMEIMDSSNGFLVLTDLFGSTPCNIAAHLQNLGYKERVRIVTGLNLPMLIRVMNYATLTLSELAEKAVSGGRDGIVNYQHCSE